MKLSFKEFLIEQANVINVGEYKLEQREEREDDNVKIWHTATTPDGKRVVLPHTPYEHLTKNDFAKYVAFHKKHGRFPKRGEVGTGNLDKQDLNKLDEAASQTKSKKNLHNQLKQINHQLKMMKGGDDRGQSSVEFVDKRASLQRQKKEILKQLQN